MRTSRCPDQTDAVHSLPEIERTPTHHLFRELTQQITILAHDALGDFQLCRELRVERSQSDAIRRFEHHQLIPALHAKFLEDFPRQDHACGVADGGELSCAHARHHFRGVIRIGV